MAAAPHAEVLQIGELEIRPAEGLVIAGGRVIPLSAREVGVLVALATHAGHVVSRADLYARVWGGALRDGDRSVDVYVHKVRAKLEDAVPHASFIHTHVGFGYRLSPELSHTFHNRATGT